MRIRVLAGSVFAVTFLGLGMLLGSLTSAGEASAQTSTATPQSGKSQSATPTTAVTKQQAVQTALATSPGNTVDHTALVKDSNGTLVWDVDFTNGGGVVVDATTGKVVATEAAGQDKGFGGRGAGHGRGARGGNQAALAAQAKVTKQQAEQTALTASPGNTVAHSSLMKDSNGTLVWDVDFTNNGGVIVDATTGKVIKTEAAGTDTHQGRPARPGGKAKATPTATP